MKRRASLFVALICLMCTALVPLFGVSASAEISDDTSLYCRDRLAEMADAEAMLYAYDKICEGIENCAAEIDVYDGVHPLSQESLAVVMDAYRRDRADQFWLGSTYKISYTSESVTAFKPTYLLEGAELDYARARFNERIEELCALVTPGMTELEKELVLHDALVESVMYVEGTHAHNAYGALVLGEAVCEGYAEALQCLLKRVGLDCFIATGSSINPDTGVGEAHAWCCVRVDGEFYYVDPTWNDQGEDIFHAYFNMSEAMISADHSFNDCAFDLPECDSDAAWYYNSVRTVLAQPYTAEAVADAFEAGAGKAPMYPAGGVSSFTSWLATSPNVRDVAELIGVEGAFSYGISSLGGEVYLYISGCEHDDLTYVEAEPATCIHSGQKAHYVCVCGKLFLDAYGINPTDYTSIRISPSGVHGYDNACDTDCNGCGKKRTVPDHIYTDACDADCNECGEARIAPHLYENGCDGDCDSCGESRVAPHEYATPCTDVCLCGVQSRAAEHLYDNGCDGECNECGYVREAPHDITKNGYNDTEHFLSCECGKRTSDYEPHGYSDGRCAVCGCPDESATASDKLQWRGIEGIIEWFNGLGPLDGNRIALRKQTVVICVGAVLLLIIITLLSKKKKR